jgi:hypothetical protein
VVEVAFPSAFLEARWNAIGDLMLMPALPSPKFSTGCPRFPVDCLHGVIVEVP